MTIGHWSLTTGHWSLLFRVFHRSRFSHHRDLDLARVIKLLLDGPGDIVADLDGFAVGGARGVGDDAHFPAGLDGVGVLDAWEAGRHRLQLLEALHIFLERLAAS